MTQIPRRSKNNGRRSPYERNSPNYGKQKDRLTLFHRRGAGYHRKDMRLQPPTMPNQRLRLRPKLQITKKHIDLNNKINIK